MAQHPIDPAQGGTGVNNDNSSTITVSGAYGLTLTLSAATNVTLPTSGTLITSSSSITASQLPAFTGDATSSAGSSVLTLATVNSNVGSFTNASITVNAKGLVTAVSSGTAPVTSFNTRSGAVTLTSTDVTTALGFTPASNSVGGFNDVIYNSGGSLTGTSGLQFDGTNTVTIGGSGTSSANITTANSTGTINITAIDISGGNGGEINITAGNSISGGNGGYVTLQGGLGTGSSLGGGVQLLGANSGGTGGATAGSILITAGNGTGATGALGGNIIMNAGTSVSGAPGWIYLASPGGVKLNNAVGLSGQVFTSQGAAQPLWTSLTPTAVGLSNVTNDAQVKLSSFTAKGDLVVGTGASTVTTLGIGTNTYVLTADSTQTSGMKWAVIPSAPVSSVFGRTGAVVAATNDYSFSQISGSVAASQMPALTGDITTTAGTVATTLATVNSNVGTFGDASHSATFTVNGKGLITAASQTAIAIASSAVSGLAASATIDTTNAANITSGTLPSGRLVGVYSGITGLGTQTQALNMNSNQINNVATPTSSTDAANKAYVDSIAVGLTWKNPVKAATTANLTSTYVGSPTFTLTNSGAQAAFATDGYTALANDRILVKNQTTQSQNGIYVVTNVGSSSTNWVLTRATDFNEVTPINEVNGAAVYAEQGTLYSNTGWTQIDKVVTFDTDPIAFSQFSGAGSGVSSITAGTGISTSAPTGAITLTNTGVTSISGTANEVAVSASTGAVTLSLPQNVIIPTPSSGAALTVNGASGVLPVLINSIFTASPATADAEQLIEFGNNTAISGLTFSGTDARLATLTITPDNYIALRATNVGLIGSGSVGLWADGYTPNPMLSINSTGNVTINAPTSGTALTVGYVGTSPSIATTGIVDIKTPSTSWYGSDIGLGVGGDIMIGNSGTNSANALAFNCYYNGGFKYLETGGANVIQTDGLGNLSVFCAAPGTAGAAVPFVVPMTIGNAGNVTIAAPASGPVLTLDGYVQATSYIQATNYIADQNGSIGQYNFSGGSGSTWYNAGWRNDGNNIYLLMSNAVASQAIADTTSWNTLRPFAVNLADAAVAIGPAAANITPLTVNAAAGANTLELYGTGTVNGHALFAFDSGGNAYLYNTQGTSFDIGGTAAGSYLNFVSSNAIRMNINSTGNVTINSPSSGVALTVNGSGTGITTVNVSDTGNSSNGVNLTLTGNGSVTPTKTLRVLNGNFQLTNSAYSATLMSVSDSGIFSFYPTGTSGGLEVYTTATYTAQLNLAGNGNTIGVTDAVINQDGANNLNIYNRANGYIYIGTDNITRGQISNSGNWTINAPASGTALTVGYVGTSPSITTTGIADIKTPNTSWYNSEIALGVGGDMMLGGSGTNTANALTFNCYYSGGWKYYETGGANVLRSDGLGNLSVLCAAPGTAGSAITFVTPLTIGSAGNVTIAAPSSSYALTVDAYATAPGIFVNSTTQGTIIQGTDGVNTAAFMGFDTSHNAQFGSAGVTYGVALYAGANRLLINSSGNVTINAPSSGVALTVDAVSGTHSTQIADSTGTLHNAGYLEVPQNLQSANYTLVLADSGKHIYVNSSGVTVTIPSNASVAFPVGTVITILNGINSNTTLAITTDTLNWFQGGTNSTGTRTIAQYSVVTIIKINSTGWALSGNGIS